MGKDNLAQGSAISFAHRGYLEHALEIRIICRGSSQISRTHSDHGQHMKIYEPGTSESIQQEHKALGDFLITEKYCLL